MDKLWQIHTMEDYSKTIKLSIHVKARMKFQSIMQGEKSLMYNDMCMSFEKRPNNEEKNQERNSYRGNVWNSRAFSILIMVVITQHILLSKLKIQG